MWLIEKVLVRHAFVDLPGNAARESKYLPGRLLDSDTRSCRLLQSAYSIGLEKAQKTRLQN